MLDHGTPANWQPGQMKPLPLSETRQGGTGCVLSDGPFALFGCRMAGNNNVAGEKDADACAKLIIDADGACWKDLPPMHQKRNRFACAAVAGCVLFADGCCDPTVEVYEEGLRCWRRLPCNLPDE